MSKVFIGNSQLVTKEKIFQESQGSNFHAILPALTWVSSIQHNRLFNLQVKFHPPENYGRAGHSFDKLTQISEGNTV
jgi:hypothetical protein